MSDDPVRLLSGGDDAFASSLLRSARDGDAATARHRKAAVLGAAGGAALGGAAFAATRLSAKGVWAALGGSWLGTGALAALAGLGVGAGVFLVRHPDPAPTSLAASAPMSALPSAALAPALPPEAPPAEAHATEAPTEASAASDAPAPSEALVAPSTEPLHPRSAATAPPPAAANAPAATPAAAPAPAPTTAASALSDEVAALIVARQALGRGQPQKCLEAVNAYFARFPAGRLSAEARVLRVEAMYAGGQRAQAATLARAMLAQSPGSPYAARLRVLAGEDAAANPR